MSTPYELSKALTDARDRHRTAYDNACITDDIELPVTFAVFSQTNPHAAEVDAASRAVSDAHAALVAEQTCMGVHAFATAVLHGARDSRGEN